MTAPRLQTQVAIIGAGPIGLELAAALKQQGVDYLQFDAGQVGQTITWYPRQARFFSSPERIAIAGLPLHTTDQTKATREEYLAYLRSVVEHYDLQVNTYERVTQITRDEENGEFLLRTVHHGETRSYFAKYIVLAVGDMHRPRLLHVPGEDLEHVTHYFEEPHRYFRQKVLIVGGRNSAVEAALRCHHIGAHVSISYRQPTFDSSSIKYWLLPELEALIRHKQIGFYPCTVPKQITRNHVTLGPSDLLECREMDAPREPTNVDADFVLMLTGYVMDTTLFDMAGIELEGENHAPKVNPDTMQSNVPNIFVAGTAAAGTQEHFRLFIENCHNHVTKIVTAITGQAPAPSLVNQAAKTFDLPES